MQVCNICVDGDRGLVFPNGFFIITCGFKNIAARSMGFECARCKRDRNL
jgi:hypothetical protein